MAKNIKENVKILTCNACQKQHVIAKDLKSFSFECEGCKNEIFVDDNGNQIVIGTIKKTEVDVSDNADSKQPDKKEDDKEGSKGSKFDLIQE